MILFYLPNDPTPSGVVVPSSPQAVVGSTLAC